MGHVVPESSAPSLWVKPCTNHAKLLYFCDLEAAETDVNIIYCLNNTFRWGNDRKKLHFTLIKLSSAFHIVCLQVQCKDCFVELTKSLLGGCEWMMLWFAVSKEGDPKHRVYWCFFFISNDFVFIFTNLTLFCRLMAEGLLCVSSVLGSLILVVWVVRLYTSSLRFDFCTGGLYTVSF